MRQAALFILTLALLAACGGGRGKMHLDGELTGLRQADLLIWNNDGAATGDIDTIHIKSGRFEYEQMTDDYTSSWTIAYPNFTTITIFAASGDHIRLEGKSNELRSVKVTGTKDNELYTDYRLGKKTAEDIITAHPQSAAALHIFKQAFVNDSLASRPTAAKLYNILRSANPDNTRLASWEPHVAHPAPLRVGAKLPPFTAVLATGDTLTLDSLRGKRIVIGVWAAWESECRNMIREIREARWRDKKVSAITINVDFDPKSRQTFEWLDSISWHRINSTYLFAHPLLQQWGINTVPFVITTDTAGIILSLGDKMPKAEEPEKKEGTITLF